jgi:hypothetical protein
MALTRESVPLLGPVWPNTKRYPPGKAAPNDTSGCVDMAICIQLRLHVEDTIRCIDVLGMYLWGSYLLELACKHTKEEKV